MSGGAHAEMASSRTIGAASQVDFGAYGYGEYTIPLSVFKQISA